MINLTLDAILAFMRKNQYEADLQPDTQQVFTILKMNQKEYPLFLRIFDDGPLLQILVFIPSHLTANEQLAQDKETPKKFLQSAEEKRAVSEVARLLHLLNKELDLPGFGMDEIFGVVYYRLMLPAPKKKIDGELLLAFLKTVQHVCKMFSQPIEALSSGQVSLDEIFAKAREMDKK